MNSINPKNQEDIFLLKLLRNRNQLCQEVIPTELRNEFVQEILPDDVLKAYAQALCDKYAFDTSFPTDVMNEYLQRRININRFGERIQLRNVDPKVVISGMLQDI